MVPREKPEKGSIETKKFNAELNYPFKEKVLINMIVIVR